MSLSIASSNAGYVAPTAPKGATLDAEKARYQQQLSDCVNCASASTIEGKVKIAEVSAKLSDVNAKLAQTGDTAATPTALSATASVGNAVNVFA